jgi:hypothetical protein
MELLKNQWMEKTEFTPQGLLVWNECSKDSARQGDATRPIRNRLKTESYLIPFQTYLWEHRTLGRPKCRGVY